MCFVRFDLIKKRLPHSGHLWNILLCRLECIFSCSLYRNFSAHCVHWYLKSSESRNTNVTKEGCGKCFEKTAFIEMKSQTTYSDVFSGVFSVQFRPNIAYRIDCMGIVSQHYACFGGSSYEPV